VAPPTVEGPVQPPQPTPTPVDDAPGEQTAARAPENLPIAPAPAPAPIAEPPRVAVRNDQDSVRDTLRRYQAAYRSLDVNAIIQVYPSLDRAQADSLRRTFASVTQYEVEIRNPQIDVQVDSAIVRAEVARRMTPRVGNPFTNEVQTEFRLRREGSTWLIASVTAR
jgi:hypothetical protein